MQADGRGGGQARRFDARAVDELLRALGLADDEFVVILMRAQTGKARDGLADGQMLDGRARLLDQVVQTLGGGVRALTVVDVDGRRPTMVLPWTVGLTSTPLPSLPGSWKMVCETKSPVFLSSRQ